MQTLRCDVIALVIVQCGGGGGGVETRHNLRRGCLCNKPLLVLVHLKLVFVHSERVSNVSAVLILIALILTLTIIIIAVVREGIDVV